MVKGCVQPRCGVVAARAILREARQAVVRIRRAIEIREMTADAGGARRRKVVICVTLRAIQLRVGAGEGEPSELGMIKLRSQPAVHGVALLAVGRKVQRGVVRVIGLLEIGAVT